MRIKAVVLNPKDNVGVALMDLESGAELDLKSDGKIVHVRLIEPIRYQHKFSIKHIDSGSKITKYGEIIGEAIKDIEPGQHVHIHNLTSLLKK